MRRCIDRGGAFWGRGPRLNQNRNPPRSTKPRQPTQRFVIVSGKKALLDAGLPIEGKALDELNRARWGGEGREGGEGPKRAVRWLCFGGRRGGPACACACLA
jgi:hypothetical protein